MDDRVLEDPAAAIARISAELADLRSTTLARQARMPTGDVELAFRTTPKPGTLFLHGQTLNRADYPDLWAWAQGAGAVVAGGYGAGNGSTTFTLPDTRGRVVRGVGATEALGALIGADSRVLSEAQMPSHDHTASTSSDAHTHTGSTGSDAHSHGGNTSGGGGHGGHCSGTSNVTQAGSGVTLPANYSGGGGDHSHSISTSSDSHSHSMSLNNDTHGHTVTIGAAGGITAVDLRQASLGLHLAVWT